MAGEKKTTSTQKSEKYMEQMEHREGGPLPADKWSYHMLSPDPHN